MTTTDELRRMLDERGVEWDYGITGSATTRFSVNGIDLTFTPMRDGLACSTILTPEQAIAATLGAWTCKPREVRSRFSKTQEYVTYHCECGHELGGYMTAELPFPHTYNEDKLPDYCPNCGRRIVE